MKTNAEARQPLSKSDLTKELNKYIYMLRMHLNEHAANTINIEYIQYLEVQISVLEDMLSISDKVAA